MIENNGFYNETEDTDINEGPSQTKSVLKKLTDWKKLIYGPYQANDKIELEKNNSFSTMIGYNPFNYVGKRGINFFIK